MKTLLNNDIYEKFANFRQGIVGLGGFQQWVEENHERLAAQIAAGILLKLRRGDTRKVMASIATLVPTCVKCGSICQAGPFTTR